MLSRASRIVVVDDEPADITFITKAFERGAGDHDVVAFRTSADFFEYLQSCHENVEPPDIMLLDLSLPGMSGLEILSKIRNGELCSDIIVIVLTSSAYRREVQAAYAAGANAFVTKPARLADLDRLVLAIEEFWLDLAHSPYS